MGISQEILRHAEPIKLRSERRICQQIFCPLAIVERDFKVPLRCFIPKAEVNSSAEIGRSNRLTRRHSYGEVVARNLFQIRIVLPKRKHREANEIAIAPFASGPADGAMHTHRTSCLSSANLPLDYPLQS